MSADLGSAGLWIAFAAMAAMNYAIRIGGFWLMGHVKLTPFVRRTLRALPGAVIVSTILPVAAHGGLAAVLAIGAAVAVMAWRRMELPAVICGIAVAMAVRVFVP